MQKRKQAQWRAREAKQHIENDGINRSHAYLMVKKFEIVQFARVPGDKPIEENYTFLARKWKI